MKRKTKKGRKNKAWQDGITNKFRMNSEMWTAECGNNSRAPCPTHREAWSTETQQPRT